MTRRTKAQRDALNAKIEALCQERGYKFKPWEWPRPWHSGLDGPPRSEDTDNTRKARRLRAQLIAELEAAGSPGRHREPPGPHSPGR